MRCTLCADMADGAQSETSAPMDKSFFDRVMVIVTSNQAVIAEREREEADEARRLEEARIARWSRFFPPPIAWWREGQGFIHSARNAQREREAADEARRLEEAREARVARMNRQLAWGEDGAPAAPIEGPRPRRRAQRPIVYHGIVVIDE